MQPESRLILGDALDVLRGLPDGSVDAVVTDPPAGIAFMGKTWDKPGVLGVSGGKAMPTTTASRNPSCKLCGGRQRAGPATKPCECDRPDWNDRDRLKGDRAAFIGFLSEVLAECLRVAKPGARMLCWALPRTAHWTGMAVEDAGWLIENKCYHLFGQGFPKGKSQLKPAAEEWILARKPGGPVPPLQIDACRVSSGSDYHELDVTQGAEDRIYGNGNGLRSEPTRFKPAAGRWPANVVLSHSDGCRPAGTRRVKGSHDQGKPGKGGAFGQNGVYGRANGASSSTPTYTDPDGLETVENYLCVEGCPIRQLDEMAGERGRIGPDHVSRTALGSMNDDGWQPKPTLSLGYHDSGGPSRFFTTFAPEPDAAFGYFPKASRRDRGEGNTHPTVKSTDLMRWLCRLIAGPGDVILDPFAGSGSTGKAAILEGMGFLGIERDPAYHAIGAARLAAAGAQPLFPACR